MSALDWNDWISRSPPLARITPAALDDALDGFPLQPKGGMERLARAIQGALAFSFPSVSEWSNPETGEGCVITVPNATEAKRIYGKLAATAEELFAGIIRNRDLLAYSLATPARYAEIHNQIEQIATFLADAASSAEPSRQRWRDRRAREELLQMAVVLSPVFELAFGRKPAVINRPDSDGGPWPDFFRRVVALAFPETKVRDLHGVLKEARRIDRFDRVTFAAGQLGE